MTKATLSIIIVVLVLIILAGVLVLMTVPVSGQEPTATPEYRIYLPLILRGDEAGPPPTATATPGKGPPSTATPTATSTATATPVPTNTPTVTPTPQPSGTVEVVSSSTYWSWDTLMVVGEVINNSPYNAEWIVVTVVLRDGAGNALYTEDAYVMTEILGPGQKAPFKVYTWDAPAYTSYTFVVDFDRTEHPVPALEVLSATVTGDLYIAGEVRNNHAWKTYNWVRAAATLYDAAGVVVNCGADTTSPDDLGAGATGVYSVWFWDGLTVMPAWTSYAVTAYGWDW